MRPWLQTYTGDGVFFELADPRHIHINDIAHALSNICRFGGHTRRFYSVAQHSVEVLRIGEEQMKRGTFNHSNETNLKLDYRRQLLMHDTAEAYLGDVVRPFKVFHNDVYGKYFEDFEKVIAAKFKHTYPYSPFVKSCDLIALSTECRDLMHGEHPMDWMEMPAPSDWHIYPLSPKKAKNLFLEKYEELHGSLER